MEPNKTHVRLRDALLEFVAENSSPTLDPFRDALANWGHDWIAAAAVYLPVSDFLTAALAGTNTQTHALTDLFRRENEKLKWEQTYTKADGVVSDDMLQRYGFVEIIGKRGPFVSDKVRCGIGVFGPNVQYPMHYHGAEELYFLLSGSAHFRFDDGPVEVREVGDMVYVPSMMKHGFDILDKPLVIFYIWQAGDLREKSKFV
jgi:mannose-6-phosphate isomerase-like protein (cupin superfamily)